MTTLQNLEQAELELSKAKDAIKAARDNLGIHFITDSYLAEVFKDISHARMAIAGEIRGRERLGEAS